MSTLTIQKNQEDTKLTVSLIGRVDTTTSPQFEEEVSPSLDGVTELVLDFSQTEYISSAGLRVIVSLYKKLNAKGGRLAACRVNHTVMNVFITTGLIDLLEII